MGVVQHFTVDSVDYLTGVRRCMGPLQLPTAASINCSTRGRPPPGLQSVQLVTFCPLLPPAEVVLTIQRSLLRQRKEVLRGEVRAAARCARCVLCLLCLLPASTHPQHALHWPAL